MSLNYFVRNFIEHNATRAGRVITSDHSKIHEGHGYVLTHRVNLSNNTSASVVINTPPADAALPFIHLKIYNGNLNGDGLLQVVESPGTPSTSQALTIFNKNRQSNIESAASAVYTTASLAGTVIESLGIGGGGSGANSTKGINTLDNEFVLKPDSSYALILTNQSGQTKNCDFYLFWYEEAYHGGEQP